MNKRLLGLDYLRGLAAFSIMMYHYTLFNYGPQDAGTIIGRIGIYGVSVFYILSGLTLFHVYKRKIVDFRDLGPFFIRRSLRILPLLWLVTITGLILSHSSPDPAKLILNLTGLFGLFRWDSYYAAGAWSIGNEVVFYLFLPLFVILCRYTRKVFYFLGGIIFLIFVFFAFFEITGSTLESSWSSYVNPLNQLFLFYAGFSIGFFLTKVNVSFFLTTLTLLLGLVIFITAPVSGDLIELVIGANRILFTGACLLIVIAFFKFPKLPGLIGKPLGFLGEISYSVYLLHPLVYALFLKYLPHQKNLIITVCSVITLLFSYFVYTYFESFFMNIGRGEVQLQQVTIEVPNGKRTNSNIY